MTRHFASDGARKFLQGYYLATPAFLVVDFLVGLNIRLTLPWEFAPAWYSYYLACFFIGYLLLSGSVLGSLLALLECGVNVALLLMSVMLPIFRFDPEAAVPGSIGISGLEQLVQFFLVGAVFAVAFYRNPLIARGG